MFVGKEAVQLLVLQKWVSCIQVGLSDRFEFSELYNDVLISLSRKRLHAFSTNHGIARWHLTSLCEVPHY